jgi:serine/arginine repetitive matrix protein 1
MAPRVEKLIKVCCRWINKRISEILGNEDDVVIELCSNLLEGSRYVRCLPCELDGMS